jgi:hypothetical protein
LWQCNEFVITMSDLAVILQALNSHTLLKCLLVSQLLDFLTQASALKRHIILAQPADEPTSCAPLILPSLVREFISKTTGMITSGSAGCLGCAEGYCMGYVSTC